MPGGGPIPGGAFIPGGGAPLPGGGPIPGGYRFGSDMLVFPCYTNNTDKKKVIDRERLPYRRIYTLMLAASMKVYHRRVSIFASSILPLRHQTSGPRNDAG